MCFKPFLTVGHMADLIANYFQQHQTSGVVEGLNHKLKVLKRRCFGIYNSGMCSNASRSIWTATGVLVHGRGYINKYGHYHGKSGEPKGSIEAGKWADLVVLEDDLLTLPEDRIRDLAIGATIVGGQLVYEATPTPAR